MEEDKENAKDADVVVINPPNEINKQERRPTFNNSPEWKENVGCKYMRDTWDSYRAVGIQLVSSVNRLDVITTRMLFRCATCCHHEFSDSRLQAMKVLGEYIRKGKYASEEIDFSLVGNVICKLRRDVKEGQREKQELDEYVFLAQQMADNCENCGFVEYQLLFASLPID